MASKQYKDEFKAEAIKQVTERASQLRRLPNGLLSLPIACTRWLRKAKGGRLAGTPEG